VGDVYNTNFLRTEDPELLGNITIRYKDELNSDYTEIHTRSCNVQYTWTDTEIRLLYPNMQSSAHIRENEIVLHMENRTHDAHLLTIVLGTQEKKELIYSVCEKDTYQITIPLMENTD